MILELTNIRVALVVTFIGFLALAFAGAAHAAPNEFVLHTVSDEYTHWEQADIPLHYSINPTGMPVGASAAIQNSFQAWEDVGTAEMSFIYDGTTTVASIGDDDTNVVLWVSGSGAWTYGDNVAAFTTIVVNATNGRITDADLELNGTPEFTLDNPWTATGEAGKVDIQNMVTHEVGHFFGLGHFSDTEATMYPDMTLGETKKRSLEQIDKNAVSFLYPTSPVNLEIVSGDGQAGAAGTPLPEPLVVRVTNGSGTPLEGEFVIFDITSGDGTLADTFPIPTDAFGQAQTTVTPNDDQIMKVRVVAAGLVEEEFSYLNRGNTAPTLTWTGDTNYESDGLHPEVGNGSTPFVFRIKYTDAENDYPALHRVWIDIDGDDVFDDPGERFNMTGDGEYPYFGTVYEVTVIIPFSPGSSNIKYYFEFSDFGLPAEGITSAISAATAINAPDVLPTLNATVTPSSWPIGLMQPGAVAQSSRLEVTNNGDGPETFSLQITVEGSEWTADTTNGIETYTLRALFGGMSDTPGLADFAEDDAVSLTTAPASDTVFGAAGLSATGVSVPQGEQRGLWFQFGAPTQTMQTGMQSIEVTLSAQP